MAATPEQAPARRPLAEADPDVDELAAAFASTRLDVPTTPRRSPIAVPGPTPRRSATPPPELAVPTRRTPSRTPRRQLSTSPINRPAAVPDRIALPPLRPYQKDLCTAFNDSVLRGSRKLCMFLPTGGGKTRIATELIWRTLRDGSRALFVLNRDALVTQTLRVVRDAGLGACTSAIRGKSRPHPARLTVASIQALTARGENRLPAADLIVIDEAHCAVARTYRDLLAAYPAATVLGLTATPTRMQPFEHLSAVFGRLLEGPDVASLVRRGHLVAPYVIDLAAATRGVRGARFCLARDDLTSRTAVTTAVDGWLERAHGMRTLCFACTVAHSKALVEEFTRRGVAAAHVDGKTRDRDRSDYFAALRRGDTQVLSSVGVLSEGFDEPRIACVMLCRPTESPVLFVQQVGRGLRASQGKSHCVVLDQAGNTWRHGSVMDPPKYLASWRDRRGAAAPDYSGKGPTQSAAASLVKRCPGRIRSPPAPCQALLHAGAAACHVCGHDFGSGEKRRGSKESKPSRGSKGSKHSKSRSHRRDNTHGRSGPAQAPPPTAASPSPSPPPTRPRARVPPAVDVNSLLEDMVGLSMEDEIK